MTNPFVRKLHRFSPLEAAARNGLEAAAPRAFPVGRRQDLIREGDIPQGLYAVLQGFACRYKILADGTRQILAYVLPGDHCNLHGTVFGEMDHSIGTLAPCSVLHFTDEDIQYIAEQQPRLMQALRRAELVQEATSREWLANIGRRRADQRIAHLLCEVLLRLEVTGLTQNNSFELPLTQEDLGDTTGLSIVHVNRVLQSLRRDGLILSRGSSLTVLDLDRLKHLAQFRPNYLHLDDSRPGADTTEVAVAAQ